MTLHTNTDRLLGSGLAEQGLILCMKQGMVVEFNVLRPRRYYLAPLPPTVPTGLCPPH